MFVCCNPDSPEDNLLLYWWSQILSSAFLFMDVIRMQPDPEVFIQIILLHHLVWCSWSSMFPAAVLVVLDLNLAFLICYPCPMPVNELVMCRCSFLGTFHVPGFSEPYPRNTEHVGPWSTIFYQLLECAGFLRIQRCSRICVTCCCIQ